MIISRLKYNNDDVGIQMGRTKVFLRHFAFECLEFMRNRLLQDSAVKLQALWRMIMTRTRFLTILASAIVIQGVARRLHSIKIVLRARGHKMATIIQAIWRGFVAERRFFAAFLIAIWCQRFYRGMIARELCACKFLEAKILLIQRSWRGFRTRLWLWNLSQATLTIQMAIRVFFACKRFRALRREARDVESIKKQRDLLREEVIRLKKEIENSKGKSSYRGDSDADEVMRLKSELAQLKWKLFGSSIQKDPPDKSDIMDDMEKTKPLLASPFPHDLKGDSWQNIVGRHDEAPSIASDCSFMNRSLLDEAEETECELQNDNMQVSNNANVSDTNEIHYILDEFHGDSISNHSLTQIEAFHHAITTNDTSSFSAILTESNSLVHEVNAYGKSPLHLAIATGNLYLVKTLLRHGAVANYQDLDGNTPLLLTNDRDIISLLLHEGKANPDIPNNDGMCAIHNAVSRLDIESLKLILQCKANVNVADNAEWRTPLHIACSMKTDKADCGKQINIVRMLCSATLPNVVDVNFQDKSGNTPLHYVAILEVEGACDLLRILLEHNALPNASNLRAQTPLHLLCHNDALRKVQVMQEMLHNLLFYGADPNLPSHTGCTALHLTLYHHDVDSAVQLMGHGAELHLPWRKVRSNSLGFSSFFYAT
jgi:ankyrin repeat protein